MNIFFAGHHTGTFKNGNMALHIEFTTKKIKPYSEEYMSRYAWTPCWDDLQLIFLLSYSVERLNRGTAFKPLVDVAEEVYTHYKEYIENPKPGYDNWGFK
jgi:hypothetical protein